MNLQTARHYTQAMLAENPGDGDYLLSHILGKDRSWLYAHPEYQLNHTQSKRLRELTEKCKTGKPLAYLKGYQEFYGLDFVVNEAVLIPRPETEIAVECAINSMPPNARLLELGTGCGNIAVAIACHRLDLQIVASDISSDVLDVAQSNAERHRCDITFVQSDWYQNINGCFDWIIANPPYIASEDTDSDQDAIAAEPNLALYAEDNGIAALSTIITHAGKHLAKHGTLLVEHGYKQAEAVKHLMRRAGFEDIHCLKDIAGHSRYAMAQVELSSYELNSCAPLNL